MHLQYMRSSDDVNRNNVDVDDLDSDDVYGDNRDRNHFDRNHQHHVANYFNGIDVHGDDVNLDVDHFVGDGDDLVSDYGDNFFGVDDRLDCHDGHHLVHYRNEFIDDGNQLVYHRYELVDNGNEFFHYWNGLLDEWKHVYRLHEWIHLWLHEWIHDRRLRLHLRHNDRYNDDRNDVDDEHHIYHRWYIHNRWHVGHLLLRRRRRCEPRRNDLSGWNRRRTRGDHRGWHGRAL